ncbi:unnamed protein product [Mytilus edulis]|uniref:Uncharacterized protein n=1 Tax=Mytilus edulis TaxID=6550 RepID=A0A8S3UAE1_MYTED|nr:unnamed protein product [Mytilus edulis]
MYLVSLDNIHDNTSEEKGCYKSYHWTTYMITLSIMCINNIQDNTREEKGCYKSSCTSYHWTTYMITLVKKKDVINPHVDLVSLDNIHDNTREEKGCYKSSSYNIVSLDNIHDNTCEEKGCYKSSCTSYHWTTYMITLVKKKDVINPHVPRIIEQHT